MRKLLSLICTATVLFICSGCNKWLDVQPVDQISDEQLFENKDGFYVAINGIYQQISAPELYGRHLTWGLASTIAQDYHEDYIADELWYLSQYNYTHAKSVEVTTAIWSTAYNAIANCNKVIGEVSKKDSSFFPLKSVEQRLILGEAKALRAMLHFELVRLFAPAPINDRNGRYVTYQTSYPTHFKAAIPTGAVIDSITKDLEEAQSLVSSNDTIALYNRTMMMYKLQSLFSGGNVPKGGVFFNYRIHRMNYVAIQALLARVYLYNGNKAKALEKSEYLYKEYGPSGRLKWWAFTPSYNATGANRYQKMVDDVIMACYDPELITKINQFKGTYYSHALSDEVLTWFPLSERDYRAELVNEDKVSLKWLESTSTSQNVPQQNFIMPVLRFSEIYYIYAECLFDKGLTGDALRVLNEMRYARGKTSTFSNTSADGFYKELFDEYRREFLVEGQTVFNHKRLNRPIELGTRRIEMDSRFVLPVPDGEKIF
jgi:hypothetical protein